jgi:hypothetical protein
MVEQLVSQWEHAFRVLWGNESGVTPAQRLAAIDTDAAELFATNTALIEFLVPLLSGRDDALVARIMARVAVIPPHTVHEDGTVTID